MALTYAQLDALTTNAALIGRVRQCVAYQADYWLNFAGATGEQTWWAAKVFQGLQCGQRAYAKLTITPAGPIYPADGTIVRRKFGRSVISPS